MNTAEISYNAAGLHAVGYLAAPHRSDPHGGVLMFAAVGTDDPLIPTAQHDPFRQEMATRGADYVLEVFDGVGHCFTNTAVDALGIPGIAYDEATDRSTWASMTRL